jgi:hypothetical protein
VEKGSYKTRVLAVLRCGAEPANGNTGSYFGCPREKRAVRALIKAGIAEVVKVDYGKDGWVGTHGIDGYRGIIWLVARLVVK